MTVGAEHFITPGFVVHRTGWLLLLAGIAALAASANAQMFGDRQLGGFLAATIPPAP